MDLNFTKSETNSIIPKAVIVYNEVTNNNRNSTPYITIHKVKNNNVNAGKPISKRMLYHLLKLVKPSEFDESCEIDFDYWIDHRIIKVVWTERKRHIIWIEDAKFVEMNFIERLGLPENKAMPVPPTVFCYNNESLSVYCVKNYNAKQNEQLYHAPYFNTNGSVCIGSGMKGLYFSNRNDISEVITKYSEMFWHSYFSEVHGNPYAKKIIDMYKQFLGSKKPFPLRRLIKANKKLNDLL